jgi:DNA gyrase/topoisomerase IV subunit B
MNFFVKPTKLLDCHQHGPDSAAELLVVEGDSAALAVARARDRQLQAVLPMQGKPINALKSSRKSVRNNDLLSALVDALGVGWDQEFDRTRLRYSRVILLFDPDADGIHCSALMMMFFYRWLPALIESGRLSVVRPPLYEFTARQYRDAIHAFSEQHCRTVREALDAKGIEYRMRHFRGLANLSGTTLLTTCVDPRTRREDPIRAADAEAAISIFSGKIS